MVAVLSLYAVDAIARNRAWFDDFTLSTTDVKVSYNSAKANYDAARVYNIEFQKAQDSTATVRDSIVRCIYKYSHRAVQIHPNYENALYLAAISSTLLNEPPDSALKFLIHLAGRFPNNPFVLDAIQMQGVARIPDVAQREAIWRSVLQKTPERFESNYYLAYALAEAGKFEEALPYFEKAATFNHPQRISALINYGAFNINLGRYVKALDALTTAIQLSPMDTLVLRNLHLTYLYLGDQAKAQMTHERYLQVRQQLLQQPQ